MTMNSHSEISKVPKELDVSFVASYPYIKELENPPPVSN
jgi:hypothetical protein